MAQKKIYDITAEISENLATYSDEKPEIKEIMRLKDGDICNLSRINATSHTGTHADMPAHFIENGATCHDIALDHFYGFARLVRISSASHITKADLLPYPVEAGDILLIDTGQSQYMKQSGLKKDFLALLPDAAQYLVEKKVKTLGIDYLSVDPYDSIDYPVHKTLLGNGIVILEGLILEGIPEGTYTLSALPLKIRNGDGSPVRAVLVE